MYRIPELLAPVGGLRQLKAAVENGADAVYMGGTAFNARMNADNFAEEELPQAFEYAHMRGTAVHITMNTLLRDSELSLAVEQAAKLYEWGADAFIVQDLGFGALLHRYFPEMTLHLSTQSTVYNAQGVRQAAELGFSRVVLARELSMKEIKSAVDSGGAEIEVFVHGALCMCYSGQCQMSRIIGGRSGNRGSCAQPCRLPYELCKDGQPQGRGFLLSPKDICTVEHLGELAAIGVDSLKIEGRMKSPEYVALVTSIYRKYLDEYAAKGEYRVSAEDKWALSQVFSRGDFSEGYLFGNPGKSLLSGELPKHQGIPIGKIISYNPKRRTAEVKLSVPMGNTSEAPLSMGDGVEIHNEELSGNVITYMRGNEIGYLTGQISPGDAIYKITDKALMERARRSYEAKSGEEQKELRKKAVTMDFFAHLGEAVALTVSDDTLSVTERAQSCPEPALTRPLDEETIRKQLEKTGGTPFRLKELNIDMDREPVSVRLSLLNELRRTALARFEAAWQEQQQEGRQVKPEALQAALAETKRWRASAAKIWGSSSVKKTGEREAGRDANQEQWRVSYYLFSADMEALELAQKADAEVLGSKVPISRYYLPYELFLDETYETPLAALRAVGKETVPFLPPISRGREDEFILQNLCRLKDIAAKHGICVGNPAHVKLFASDGIKVYGDYGLNLYNSSSLRLAKELGLSGAVLSNEWIAAEALKEEPEALDALLAAAVERDLELEVPAGGQTLLMVSAHCAIGDGAGGCPGRCLKGKFSLKDRKSTLYPILTRRMDCQMLLFNDKLRNDNKYLNETAAKKTINLRFYGIDKNIFCSTHKLDI